MKRMAISVSVLLAGLMLCSSSLMADVLIPSSITTSPVPEQGATDVKVLSDGYSGGSDWGDGSYCLWAGLTYVNYDLGSEQVVGRISVAFTCSSRAAVAVPSRIWVQAKLGNSDSWTDWQILDTTAEEQQFIDGKITISRLLTPFKARYIRIAFSPMSGKCYAIGEITLSTVAAHEVHRAVNVTANHDPASGFGPLSVVKDGYLGTSDWSNYAAWSRPGWSDKPHLTFDYGHDVNLDSINVSALAASAAGIGIPAEVSMRCAKQLSDLSNASWINWSTTSSERIADGRTEISRSFTPTNGRYVEVAFDYPADVDDDHSIIFIGEVQLSGNTVPNVNTPTSITGSRVPDWNSANANLNILKDEDFGTWSGSEYVYWGDGTYIGINNNNGFNYLTFDLGQAKNVDGFSCYGINKQELNPTNRWIQAPCRFFVRHSDDGSNWTDWDVYETAQVENPASSPLTPTGANYCVSRAITPFDARYVQMAWNGFSDWTFTSEINFYSASLVPEQGYPDPDALALGDAKKAKDGSRVNVSGYISAKFGDFFYIETASRASGIRVSAPDTGLALGEQVKVVGTMNSLYGPAPDYALTGERTITDATITALPGSFTITPLGMINRAVGGGDFFYIREPWQMNDLNYYQYGQEGVTGGTGPNNIGLLVRICGNVSQVDDTHFTIDDGSGTPVLVHCPSGAAPSSGYYMVTGISSCVTVDDEDDPMVKVVKRVLEVSNVDDINLI